MSGPAGPWRAMTVPAVAGGVLLVLLGGIVALAQLVPGRVASLLEAGLAVAMAGTVLLFSMDVRKAGPLLRFYALLGFTWLAVLLGFTMMDYLSR